MRTKIYLIRNVESSANIENILGENNDYEITETGYKMIDSLTKYFEDKKISNVYSSLSTICLETVEKLAQKLDIKVKTEKDLKEKSFGIYDGEKWADIIQKDPTLKKYRKKQIEILGIPKQESTKQVVDRMANVIRKIAKENLGQVILICSHGIAIETFLRAVVGIPVSDEKEKYFQKNGAINLLEYDEEIDEFEVKEVAKIIFK